MRETTLQTHADDINQIVNFYIKKYKKIYLVRHSFGGPSILLSNLNSVTAVVLWDPTYDPSFIQPEDPAEKTTFVPALNAYSINWGIEILIGKKMVDHANKCLKGNELVQRVHTPIKFIFAGDGILLKNRKQYYSHADKPKDFAIIKGATHNFDEWGTEEELFRETFKWIKKF